MVGLLFVELGQLFSFLAFFLDYKVKGQKQISGEEALCGGSAWFGIYDRST